MPRTRQHKLVGASIGGTSVLAKAESANGKARVLCRCPCGSEFSTRAMRLLAAQRDDGLVRCPRCARMAAAKQTAIVKRAARLNPTPVKIAPYVKKRQERLVARRGHLTASTTAAKPKPSEKPASQTPVTRAGVPSKKGASHTMKLCSSCAGMPHRVPGIKCPECGLRYRDEAKPELQTRMVYERAV